MGKIPWKLNKPLPKYDVYTEREKLWHIYVVAAKRISETLREYGWTHAHLAKLLDVSVITISKITSCQRPIYIHELYQIADLLDVSVEYLLGMSDDRGIGENISDKQEWMSHPVTESPEVKMELRVTEQSTDDFSQETRDFGMDNEVYHNLLVASLSETYPRRCEKVVLPWKEKEKVFGSKSFHRMHIFAKRVHERMVTCGYTMPTLASATGYTNSESFKKVISGEMDIPYTRICLLADALYTTPNYLLGYDDTALEVDVQIRQVRKRVPDDAKK